MPETSLETSASTHSALELSSSLLAQHAASQSTIFALELKVSELETFVKTTQLQPPGHCQNDATPFRLASNSLKLLPTRGRKHKKIKYTLTEKFGPFFAEELVSSWKEFLGEMFEKDPESFAGHKHAWNEGMDFIMNLGLPGFKTGLTLLQLINGLTFSSVLTHPTPSDITSWIYSNPNLGAQRGLTEVGFVLANQGFVHAAFMCIYDHMDRHLTSEDKKLLGFGPIFVEQVLCKVVRWDRRLRQGRARGLRQLADDALGAAGDWTLGANKNDPSQFPFPLVLDRSQMEAIINVSSPRTCWTDPDRFFSHDCYCKYSPGEAPVEKVVKKLQIVYNNTPRPV